MANACWYFFVLAVLMLYHGRGAFPFVTLLVVALCTITAIEVLPFGTREARLGPGTTSLFRIIFHHFFSGTVENWFGCMAAWLMCAPALEQERGSTMLLAILYAAIIVDNITYSCITAEVFPWSSWDGPVFGLIGMLLCVNTVLAMSSSTQPAVVRNLICKRSVVLVLMELVIFQLLNDGMPLFRNISGILTGLVIYCLLPYADRAIQSNRWATRVERLNSWMKHFRDYLFYLCITLLLLGFALRTCDVTDVTDALHRGVTTLSPLFASLPSSAPESLAPRVACGLVTLVAGMALWFWLTRGRRAHL